MIKKVIPQNIKAAMVAALLFIIQLSTSMASASTGASSNKRTSTFENPDFAFPQTVEKDAMPILDKALKNKNGVEALKAAIQVVVARNLVSESNFNRNVELLDSAARIMTAPYNQLFYLLEATMYTQLYEDNSWNYNQRILPVDIFPSDPLSWSKDLFCKKVLDLTDKAVTSDATAKDMPIKTISPILADSEVSEKYDLSAYDFIIYTASKILNTFGNVSSDRVIPFRSSEISATMSLPEQCARRSGELLSDLLKYREDVNNIPALTVAVDWYAKSLDWDKRKEFLKEWKDRLIHNEWDARLLREYYQSVKDSEFIGTKAQKELYQQMADWLKEFPDAYASNVVKYDMAQMAQPTVKMNVPNVLLPKTPGTGKITMCNVNQVYVLIYKVPESIATGNSINMKKFPSGCTRIATVPVTARGDVPFVEECEFDIPELSAGKYVMIPSSTSYLTSGWRNKLNMWSVGAVNVSDISIISISNSSEDNSGVIYVVNSRNQQPISGARIAIYDNGGKNKVIKEGKTDSQGAFKFPKGNYRVKATYGNSIAEEWFGYRYGKPNERTVALANILTDLSIYRPGSKMEFALVGWTRSSSNNALLKNEKVRVSLRDANYNVVDTVALTTDVYGRCNGEFVLPSSGLLGMYTLEAVFDSYPNRTAGRSSIQVAEYKTPGFFVELNADSAKNYKAGDLLNFKGYVKTYSGMPISDAKISFNVRWNPWWRYWRGSNANASYGGELTTDEKGCFVISLPTENLKNTEFEFGTYTIAVNATSPAGETQNAPDFRFSLGTGFNINPVIPDNICLTGDEVQFNVPVYDMLGLPTIKHVEYELKDISDKKVILSGEFDSPVLKLKSKQIPSGKYEFSFNLAGDTLKTNAEIVLWRKSDKTPPYSTPLWVPEQNIVAKDGSKSVDIEFGSGYPDSWILAIVTDQNGIVSREWIMVNGENKKISVKSPGNDGRVWVTLSGMHEFDQQVSTVSIIPENSMKKLSVKAETFRDRISSGDKEQWRFKFTVDNKSAGQIPVFAVMSDKALNALSPFVWHFNVGRDFFRFATSVSRFYPGFVYVSGQFSKLPEFAYIGNPIPVWNTYGYNLGNNRRNYYSMQTKTSSLTGSVKAKGAVALSADSVEDEVFYAAAEEVSAPKYANAVMMKSESADLAVEEEMQESEVDGAGGANVNDIELRPVELPLAFFKPDLKSDEDGNVTLDFETPDFNTTWQFQLMGYTEDLLTSGLIKDAVASKQVMVRSNPPRYLRTGDKARISALLFNNSDTDIDLGGELVIFDPLTGTTLASNKVQPKKTSPSSNRVISIEWNVPSDLQAIGVRAYAYGDNHSDGEQSVVPILPSSAPVVESTQFYVGNDKQTFSKKLPKYSKDANITLKYCDNPIWECVLALPSIATPESKNVVSLMKSLYANSIALDVVNRYPYVKSGLEKVLTSNEESAQNVLKSNLEKDAELKTVELVNTPWVNNASSETLRMRSLDKLLDPGVADASVMQLIKEVKGLQNIDGGWSWCPGMRSSEFITRDVLMRFGMMNKSGVLPSGCDKMIRKGITYCDKEVFNDYLKSDRKYSTRDMLSYLYIRSFFDVGNGPSGFSTLKAKALKSISEEWERFSIYEKSIAAILLSRSKGYEKTAGIILESLNQYASKSESRGWWFDNLYSGYNGWSKLSTTAAALEAYSEISPKAPAVDGLRQWLVLQKETEDWVANSNTVEVIQAILSSGTQWTGINPSPVITLGDKQLSLPDGEMLTGIITMSLDSKIASGKELKIEKTSEGPAWGGVISQYIAPIKDVKAEKCENLKIEKKLLVVTDSPSGEVAKEGQIKVGDKVRVTLTLTCNKDMNYVALIDERGACLEPAEQISGYTVKDGLGVYREVRDSKTSFFIEFLPKGVNVITYDCFADREGVYSIGIVSIQSQYSPSQTAHSAGDTIVVTPQ